jgi:peptidoglycan-N-acetylglucosamine deacetylase
MKHTMRSRIAQAVSAWILLAWPLGAIAQSVALTFDDGFDAVRQPQAAPWNAAMLRALADAKVTAMLLPAARVADNPAGFELVKAWGAAGHVVGNHSYSHLSFGNENNSVQDFIADAEKGHSVLSRSPGWKRFFRFPYLKEGTTAERRDAMRQWLREHDYRAASVSIDASDWYYSDRFAKWRSANTGGDVSAYRDAYLAHLWDRAQYYDGLSRKVLGRSAKHVLLLHTNAINAAFLADVIRMFESKGWKIVAPLDAFSDPLYSMETKTLPAGESILWSLAKERGVSGLRYPAEDGEYEQAILDSIEGAQKSR